MPNGFRFTCKAARYGFGSGLIVERGWLIELHRKDERVTLFNGNSSFKKEVIDVPEPGEDNEPEDDPISDTSDNNKKPEETVPDTSDEDNEPEESPEDAWDDVPIDNLVELGADKITLLKDAGYATVKSVLAAGKEGLMKIEGVGPVIADNMLVLCQEYADQHDQ